MFNDILWKKSYSKKMKINVDTCSFLIYTGKVLNEKSEKEE